MDGEKHSVSRSHSSLRTEKKKRKRAFQGVSRAIHDFSTLQDNFFADHMYDNYGDIGIAVKNLVDQFSAKQKATSDISSIEDMQKFVDQFPEFRRQSGTVSKHVALMTEMSKIVDSRELLSVSQQEQVL